MSAMDLPYCAVCGEQITFYMHQRYGKDGTVVYYHPRCCPEVACQGRKVPSVLPD